jgi:hypothetical protein
MWIRKVRIDRVTGAGEVVPCPIAWIDNFAMRNFTNDAIFDDTLPIADGVLEVGTRIPVERLRDAVEDWFRRKGYLGKDETLRVEETRR